MKRAGSSPRQLRVAEEIRHVLAALFARGEFRDPELAAARITITEVRITPDLKAARVFFARLGRADGAALLPALAHVQPFLRAQVANAMRLKFAPRLHFEVDTSLDYAAEINALLHSPAVARDLG
ncbi:30S ribosome-binding factor RbfA [Acidibrevibacterium fodinaquatile]|uniref:30S ribosome-binding factor RbfA n=1 Tax=Acidibrevibacterium fodinaquatile TaxID=1969806 RepID=UPI001F080CA0|nr:30S ribosome-binding factor RbfA [Acidibrevibacterium fodinaquatile]